MPRSEIPWGSWFLNVFVWDGVLPLGVLFLAELVRLLVPNEKDVIEAVGVLVPIIASMVRCFAGFRHISRNNCSRGLRAAQYLVFIIAILVLVLAEVMMILALQTPAMVSHSGDWIVFAVHGVIYLLLMTIAMYPGRQQIDEDDGVSPEYRDLEFR